MAVILAQIDSKLERFDKSLTKLTNVKFHNTPFSSSRVVRYGRTDGQSNSVEATNMNIR
jgi:hypothetical protein